jgi:hypothetical protein
MLVRYSLLINLCGIPVALQANRRKKGLGCGALNRILLNRCSLFTRIILWRNCIKDHWHLNLTLLAHLP